MVAGTCRGCDLVQEWFLVNDTIPIKQMSRHLPPNLSMSYTVFFEPWPFELYEFYFTA